MTAQTAFARLKRYAPGLRQQAHAHDAAHLSLILAGAFEETAGRRGHAAVSGHVGLRPEGLSHAVAFSGSGALVLTCDAPGRDDAGPVIRNPAWSPVLPRLHLRRLVPLLLEGGEATAEAAWDLLALCDDRPTAPEPDRWLRAVRDRLIEAPAEVRLCVLAREAGRHRVHLGRAFLAAWGETPSVFRRRRMLDRALCLAANGQPAAAAALDAGFSDQSHFSRACRDLYGLPPGRVLAQAA